MEVSFFALDINFEERDHEILAAALRRIEGKFLLSYNDVPEIRALYRWARIEVLPVAYAIIPRAADAGRGELLIANYDTAACLGGTTERD